MTDPTKDSRRRLFFALWPNADTRNEVARLADAIELHRAARRIPPEKLHVTLAFMGDTPPDRQACYEQAADALKGEPFTLILDHFGHFPKPRVFWMGPTEYPEVLGILVKKLVTALEACGFERESRPYRPHVTLARKVNRRPSTETARVEWYCDTFCLVESAGGRYTVLREWSLT